MATPPAARRSSIPRNTTLALVLLLVFYLVQSGWLPRQLRAALGAQPLANGAAARSGSIQAFFTTTSLSYPDIESQRRPPPLLSAVLQDIAQARRSIDLASFDFDIPEISDALLRARQRGLDIRLIIDSENLQTPEVALQTGRLQQAGIPVHFDEREPFMHNKFIICDRQVVWSGSWNLTTNDTYRNNNNMLRFDNRYVAADYTHEFEQMFGGWFGSAKSSATPYPRIQAGANSIRIFFAPEDGVANYVLQQIAAAKHSIHFMTFSFTSKSIAAAMIAQKKNGRIVRGVFERQNAHGTGAVFQMLHSGEIDVLEDGNCYILHHKVIIIDERILITGSYNFTNSAEHDNDENLIMIDSPTLARAYLDEFERTYAQAQTPTRCS